MSFIVTILLLFFILPTLSGYIVHVRQTPKKRVAFYQLACRVRRWRGVEISRAAFIAITSIFYVVGIAIKIGAKFSVTATMILLVANCFAGLVYLCIYWKVSAFIGRHKDSLKLLSAPIAVFVVTLSKIMSDASIAELSGLSPQDLPGAQLFLTFIFTPVIWLLGLSLAYGYFSLPLMIGLLMFALVQNYKLHKRARAYKGPSKAPQVTLIAAVFLSSVLALTVMSKVASKSFYEPFLRQAIAFASFHLPATYCGLPESDGVEVAPMSDERAGLAIPDSKQGYIFKAIDCKATTQNTQDATALLDTRNKGKVSEVD